MRAALFLICVLPFWLGAQIPRYLGGKWNLVSVSDPANPGFDGRGIQGVSITLYLDGVCGGNDGCNSLGGDFTVGGNQLNVQIRTSTKRDCGFDRDGGYAYRKSVFGQSRFSVKGDTLRLECGGKGRKPFTLTLLRDPKGPEVLYARTIPSEFLEKEVPSAPLYGDKNYRKARILKGETILEGDYCLVVPGQSYLQPGDSLWALMKAEGLNTRWERVVAHFEWYKSPHNFHFPGENKLLQIDPPAGKWTFGLKEPPLVLLRSAKPPVSPKGEWVPISNWAGYPNVHWGDRHIHAVYSSKDSATYDLPNRYVFPLIRGDLVIWATYKKFNFSNSMTAVGGFHDKPSWLWTGDLNGDEAPDFLFRLSSPSTPLLILSNKESGYRAIMAPALTGYAAPGVDRRLLPGPYVRYRSARRDARALVDIRLGKDGSILDKQVLTHSTDPELLKAVDTILAKMPFRTAYCSEGPIQGDLTLYLNFFEAAQSPSEISQQNIRRRIYNRALETVRNQLGDRVFREWLDQGFIDPQSKDGLPVHENGDGSYRVGLRMYLPVYNPQDKTNPSFYYCRLDFTESGALITDIDRLLPKVSKKPALGRFADGAEVDALARRQLSPELMHGDAWNTIRLQMNVETGRFEWLFTYNRVTNYPKGTRALILIDAHSGEVLEKEIDRKADFKKCLPFDALIETPNGLIEVSALREGMPVYTLDEFGQKIVMPVIRMNSVHVGPAHKMHRVRYADGKEIMATPQHPMPFHLTVGTAGRRIDSVRVAERNEVVYTDGTTWDILPDGPTGYYYIDGVVVASTLKEGRDTVADRRWGAELERRALGSIGARLSPEVAGGQFFCTIHTCGADTRFREAHQGHPAALRFEWRPDGEQSAPLMDMTLYFDGQGHLLTDLSEFLPDGQEAPECLSPRLVEEWFPDMAGKSRMASAEYPIFDGKYYWFHHREGRSKKIAFRLYKERYRMISVNLCTGERMESAWKSRYFKLPEHKPRAPKVLLVPN